jgi:hypothetical protein
VKAVPTIFELRREYDELQSSLHGSERHRENFYRIVGKKVSLVYF